VFGVDLAGKFLTLSRVGFGVKPWVGGGAQSCIAQAAAMQVCGGVFVPALSVGGSGRTLGSCARGGPCCLLNPYKGCALGAAKGPWGNATVFVFGDTGVFPRSR